MKITYFGHSCFSVEVHDNLYLFDPFISGNELAKHIQIEDIEADYVLLSHGHTDHVLDVETICKNTNATLIAQFEVANWFEAKGLNNIIGMSVGGTLELGHVNAKMVGAIHSSSMPDGSYGGTASGFVLMGEKRDLYFAGDTALTLDMQLIPTFTSIDMAILPIGGHFTMDVHDAIRAAKMVETTKVLGVHYNTFPPISIDTQEAIEEFAKHDIELILPAIGKSFDL